jgi:hypothetical protein
LEPTGLAKPGKTRGLTGTGPGLARQDAAGRVFGRFWNQTKPFFRSEPGPLAGYPHPLLTLRAADVETMPNQQELQKQPEPSYRQKGDGKRNVIPSISESTQTKPKGSRSSSGSRSNHRHRTDLPSAPWVAVEAYGKRKAEGKCLCCSGDHRTQQCTKYTQATFSDKLDPNSGGEGNRQVKCHRLFDTQNPTN